MTAVGDLCPLCVLDDGADATRHVLGGCQLTEEIGRGGMGVVWRARQTGLDREVAVKVLPGGDLAGAEARARFRNEALATARLRHPNIVAVHDVGEDGGMPYLVMELVEGATLGATLVEKAVTSRQAARWLRDTALAVQHAHEHGVLHRDLKPSNVLIEPWEGGGRPRVTDFGLAKLADGDATLTRTGSAAGSPAYMAPEQARGGEAAAQGDVYALGAVLYHALTGRPPFQGDSVASILTQVARDEPLAPRRLNATVPRDLETVCLRAMEKDPARRYASAAALADDLGRFLDGRPVLARPLGPFARLARRTRRHPWQAAAVVLSVLLVAGTIFTLAHRAATERAHQRSLALEQSATQHALALSRLGEARSLVRLASPDSRQRVEEMMAPFLAADGPAELRAEARDVLVAARALPAARLVPVDHAGSAVDGDWTLAAGDLPRGRWALASFRGPVVLRALASGTALSSIATAPRTITAVIGFSPGGRWLALRHRNEFAVWDTTSDGGSGPTFAAPAWNGGHRFGFMHVAFAPDDSAVAWSDGTSVTVTALPGGTTLARWTGENGAPLSVGALTFSADGRHLALASAQRPEVVLRAWPSGEREATFASAFPRVLTAVALSPDGSVFAGGDAAGRVWRWQRASPDEPAEQMSPHRDAVRALACSPDGRHFVSTGEDATLRAHRVDGGTHVTALPFDAGWPSISADGWRVGIGLAADSPALVEISPSAVFHTLVPPSAPTTSQFVSFTADSASLHCLTATGTALLRVPDGAVIHQRHDPGSVSVLAHPAETAVSFSSGKNGVRRADGTGGPVELLGATTWGWDHLRASADGHWLAVVDSGNDRVALWPAASHTPADVRFLPLDRTLGARTVTLSPDASLAAVGYGYDAGFTVHDCRSGQEIRRFPLPPRHGLAWSPDGRWLAAAGSTFRLMDTTVWRETPLPPLVPNHAPAGAIAFDAKRGAQPCRWMAMTEGDTRLVLVSLPAARRMLTLDAPAPRPIHHLAVSPDGRWLAAAVAGGGIQLWALDSLEADLRQPSAAW